ncbi:GNAT family N-acetyltransferase [Nocardia concava]|uniref:GNAT family N-acetyltransferase n=1 Tax=Nocardia concava TaxID=257281 RepID=UPI001C3F3FA6|nr:GNAT family protein [Nocardia concava]
MESEHIHALVDAAKGGEESYRFTLVPTDLEGMTAYVDNALQERDAGLGIPFVLVDRTGVVVGSTRFRNIEHWPATSVRPPVTVAEIGGTWLSVEAQRTGVNAEAKLLLLDYAFGPMDAFRVSLMTDSRNDRSRKAIERIGATFDGVLRGHMPAFDGGVRDSATYSILRSEWQELRASLQQRIRKLNHAPNE